jgi:hypothetical protein
LNVGIFQLVHIALEFNLLAVNALNKSKPHTVSILSRRARRASAALREKSTLFSERRLLVAKTAELIKARPKNDRSPKSII